MPEKGFLAEQQPPTAGVSRKGSAKTALFFINITAKPPNIPSDTAAIVLASAKSNPSVPEVIANIAGSMRGEASQKAMTAPSGAPTASSAAMKGMTSQEQKGDNPPNRAARTIMRAGLPSNALARRVSAPEAFR